MNEAKRVALRLRQMYAHWAIDTEFDLPLLHWRDKGARDAHRIVCDLWAIGEPNARLLGE